MTDWTVLQECFLRQVDSTSVPPVVVLGGQASGLAVARALGRRGVPVFAADPDPRAPAFFSRFVLATCTVPDPFKYELQCIEAFLVLGSQVGRRAVLFPTGDEWALLIARHAERLASAFVLPPTTYDELIAILDKGALYTTAQAVGMPVPQFADLRTVPLQEAAERVGFPCAVKPAIKRDFFRRFGQAALLAKDWQELVELTSRIGDYPLILQQIIRARANDPSLYTVAVVIDRRRTTKGMLFGHRLVVFPAEFGTSCLVQSVADPGPGRHALSLLNHLRFAGIAEVEFIRDPADHRWYLIDINPRGWKWIGLPAAAGVDLVWLAYADWTDLPITETTPDPQVGMRWVSVLDIAAMVGATGADVLKPEEWRALLRGDGDLRFVDAFYDLDDPLPFARALEAATTGSLLTCAC